MRRNHSIRTLLTVCVQAKTIGKVYGMVDSIEHDLADMSANEYKPSDEVAVPYLGRDILSTTSSMPLLGRWNSARILLDGSLISYRAMIRSSVHQTNHSIKKHAQLALITPSWTSSDKFSLRLVTRLDFYQNISCTVGNIPTDICWMLVEAMCTSLQAINGSTT